MDAGSAGLVQRASYNDCLDRDLHRQQMTTSPRSAAPSDLQALFALYGARRFGDMEQLAQALLARFPNDGNVWKALSVAQQVQGKDAVPALQQAIALLRATPNCPATWAPC